VEKEEEDERKAALAALLPTRGRGRGRMTRKQIQENREEIAKILAPLPPPWEWQAYRQTAGLNSGEVSRRMGSTSPGSSTIRHWEDSGGVLRVSSIVDYATALVRIVREELESRESASRLASGEGVDIEAIRPHLTAMRGSAGSLEVWLEQPELPCSPEAMDILRGNIIRTISSLRKSANKLRSLRNAADNTEGRKEE
jgi:hypothetical protein